MIYKIVAVRDHVSKNYDNITLEISEMSAVRSFSSSVLTSRARQVGLLFTNPEDFSLWSLGDFDSESGQITTFQPVLLVKANEVD